MGASNRFQNADQPAADAAQLLLRLALALAFVAIPVIALVSRRAIFILAPVAAALIVIAGIEFVPAGGVLRLFSSI